MKALDQSCNNVTVFGIVIVAWPIHIGEYDRYEVTAVLVATGLAQFDASDFRNRRTIDWWARVRLLTFGLRSWAA